MSECIECVKLRYEVKIPVRFSFCCLQRRKFCHRIHLTYLKSSCVYLSFACVTVLHLSLTILQNFNSLRQLKRSSRVDIPQWLLDTLTPIKDDSTAVMNYGISYATEMCKQLLESGHVHGLHFYNQQWSIVPCVN